MDAISLAPLMEYMIPIVGAALTTLLGSGVMYLVRASGLEVSDAMERQVRDAAGWAARKAINYGKSYAPDTRISTDHDTLNKAVNEVLQMAGDAAAQRGWGPDQLKELVSARIEELIADDERA